MSLKIINNKKNITTNLIFLKKNFLILNDSNFKLKQQKFVINYYKNLKKTINKISLIPLIVMDYVIDITREFRVAFTSIFGVSIFKAEQLKKLFGITTNKSWKLNQFDKKIVFETNNYLNSILIGGFNLLKLINFEKEKFLETRCYKRNRFLLGLPSNGQRTHTNAMTARKFKIRL